VVAEAKERIHPYTVRDLLAAIEQSQKRVAELEARLKASEENMRLHAGDCCSLNNEVELFRSQRDDAHDELATADERVKELEGELKDAEERRAAAAGWYGRWHDVSRELATADERVKELEGAVDTLLQAFDDKHPDACHQDCFDSSDGHGYEMQELAKIKGRKALLKDGEG